MRRADRTPDGRIVSNRPRRLIVVTGTGTNIGKTWVAAATLAELRGRGLRVAARKPAQSFAPQDATTPDSAVLAGATGEPPDAVCPLHRCYPIALAPPMAAEALGRSAFGIEDLVLELNASWPADEPVDVACVEGSGGVASPQAMDGDTATLIDAVDPDLVILVAEPALGSINLVRLCLRFLGDRRPVAVHLNRFDSSCALHQRNLGWLVEREGLEVTTDVTALVERVNGQTLRSHQFRSVSPA